MHHFRPSLSKWVLTPSKETSFHIFKRLCTDTCIPHFKGFEKFAKWNKKLPKGKRTHSIYIGTIYLRRWHVLGGEGVSPLPMFADARGVVVSGMPTSAIFDIIRRQKPIWRQHYVDKFMNIIGDLSSAFFRRTQNLKPPSTWFDIYLENVKSSGRWFQIFVAFSECPNFIKIISYFLCNFLVSNLLGMLLE